MKVVGSKKVCIDFKVQGKIRKVTTACYEVIPEGTVVLPFAIGFYTSSKGYKLKSQFFCHQDVTKFPHSLCTAMGKLQTG